MVVQQAPQLLAHIFLFAVVFLSHDERFAMLSSQRPRLEPVSETKKEKRPAMALSSMKQRGWPYHIIVRLNERSSWLKNVVMSWRRESGEIPGTTVKKRQIECFLRKWCTKRQRLPTPKGCKRIGHVRGRRAGMLKQARTLLEDESGLWPPQGSSR